MSDSSTAQGPVDRRHGRRNRILKLSAGAAAAAAAFLGWQVTGRTEAPVYTQAKIERGDIVRTISATGKLQAVVTVQVGSQVSGRISEIHVDFNSRVKKGQIIARLDPSLLEAQLEQARGNLDNSMAKLQTAQTAVANAEANVAAAEANREKLRVARDDAERAYRPVQEISGTGAVSTRDVELAQAALSQADAQLSQSEAQVAQAKAQLQSARSQVNEARAQVRQMQASVELASANLGYSIIRAPIDGVVIQRSIDVGQTVAASFQAPELFRIANDLTRMQVLADIDEADVGQLNEQSKVTFTVDAYPNDVFEGKVSQIRLNPQTVQNVVTYTAVIDVSNPELKLKPGMTASVTAVVAEARNVLKAPNAALRFSPDGAGRSRHGGKSRVWKLDANGALQPVPVTVGVTDGASTALISGDLKPGDTVVTGRNAAETARTAVRNPMMPVGPRGGRR